MLLPGLCCSAQDIPGSHTVRYLKSRGYRAAVVDRRGNWRELRAPRFNMFGDPDDLEAAYYALKERLPNAPLFLFGVSAGAATLLAGLGDFDRRRALGEPAPEFTAALCSLPGFDFEKGGSLHMLGETLGTVFLLTLQAFFLKGNEEVLRAHDEKAFQEGSAATTLQEFIEAVVPFAGYKTPDEYMERHSPSRFLGNITTPTLAVMSADDPVSVTKNLYTPSRRDPSKTHLELAGSALTFCLTSSGSHCPFLDGRFFPFRYVDNVVMLATWSDEAMCDYFDHVLTQGGAPSSQTAPS
jgi:predicted alpha/beta-fold hydrolase